MIFIRYLNKLDRDFKESILNFFLESNETIVTKPTK